MRSLFAILFLLSASLAYSAPALAQDNAAIANEAAADTGNASAAPVANATQPNATNADQGQGAQGQSGANSGTAPAPQVITESGKVLVVLFVLAAILESALAWFFNLQFFAATFNGRSVKPLISCLFALAVTFGFKSVLLIDLFAKYSYDTSGADAHFLCRLIESLVLAGGSAGVNRLLRNLGIRPIDPIAERNPTPPPQEAWLAVEHSRTNAVGPVAVEISIGTNPATPAGIWQVAGQISGRKRLTGISRWLFRDRSRFPASGGYAVLPGAPIMVRLSWTKPDGTVVYSPVWGPNALADRAIVDIALPI
ncbi:hypothetical protein HZY97_04470 [Sphingomonas sp. R-74633]|uniref:hypothetical protein n=1 Tax=Sphingomonas sp. R-74633 TaxID=2751188 RepID=UPI0015D14B29|nr:hypothetical protein [Sphingomonas sp. R-74633]NYT39999.1 hypothetical protein [Sphingomonas sp. R-74633]